MNKDNKLFIREISSLFNQCALTEARHPSVSHEIGQRLIERLDYFKIQPSTILDLGCGTGVFSKALKQRYPKAELVSLDISWLMVKACLKQYSWRKRWPVVCADMHALPFKSGQFDLIFMNQVLQWSSPMDIVLQELYRVMRPQGCFMFSMLGPDTFKELSVCENRPLIRMPLIDMHHVGDALIQTGWGDPVLDMEMLTVQYRQWETLCEALHRHGVVVENSAQQLLCEQGRYPITFEVIYGHGWRMADKQKTIGHETFIPLHSLLKKGTA